MEIRAGIESATPRAWVGCLGCYNAGELVGKWLEKDEAEDLEAAGLSADGRCVRCNAEEFWVLDHENIGNAGEMTPTEFVTIAKRFETIDEHHNTEALRAFIEFYGHERDDIDDVISDFEDRYTGQYETRADWAEQYLEDSGMLNGVPGLLLYYIDTDAFARDCTYNGDVDFVDDGIGGVYVFHSN